MIEVLEPRRVMSAVSAVDDSYVVADPALGAAAVGLDVLANDSGGIGALDISSVGSAAQGMLSVVRDPVTNRASLLFMPETGYSGSQSFTYTVTDGMQSGTATVTITTPASSSGDSPFSTPDTSGASNTGSGGFRTGSTDGFNSTLPGSGTSGSTLGYPSTPKVGRERGPEN